MTAQDDYELTKQEQTRVLLAIVENKARIGLGDVDDAVIVNRGAHLFTILLAEVVRLSEARKAGDSTAGPTLQRLDWFIAVTKLIASGDTVPEPTAVSN